MARKRFSSEFKAREALEERFYSRIGKLQVEVEWLRKKSRALGLL